MRQAGSYTIAQDEASSVIFSMPKAAIELNAVEEVLDINQIAFRLKNLVENNYENQKKPNDYGKTNKK